MGFGKCLSGKLRSLIPCQEWLMPCPAFGAESWKSPLLFQLIIFIHIYTYCSPADNVLKVWVRAVSRVYRLWILSMNEEHTYINLNIYFFVSERFLLKCIIVYNLFTWKINHAQFIEHSRCLSRSVSLLSFSHFLDTVSCIPSFSTTRCCVAASVAYVPKITCCLFCCFSVYSYKLLRARQQMFMLIDNCCCCCCCTLSSTLVNCFCFYL